MRGYNSKTKGGSKMGKTIRAKFSKGVIELLEKVDIKEGEEITISILEAPSGLKKKSLLEALKATAGGLSSLQFNPSHQ